MTLSSKVALIIFLKMAAVLDLRVDLRQSEVFVVFFSLVQALSSSSYALAFSPPLLIDVLSMLIAEVFN